MKTMNIFLISSIEKVDFEEYDGIVVIANNAKDAAAIAMDECGNFKVKHPILGYSFKVIDIGVAHANQKRGAVLASFNAG